MVEVEARYSVGSNKLQLDRFSTALGASYSSSDDLVSH